MDIFLNPPEGVEHGQKCVESKEQQHFYFNKDKIRSMMTARDAVMQSYNAWIWLYAQYYSVHSYCAQIELYARDYSVHNLNFMQGFILWTVIVHTLKSMHRSILWTFIVHDLNSLNRFKLHTV